MITFWCYRLHMTSSVIRQWHDHSISLVLNVYSLSSSTMYDVYSNLAIRACRNKQNKTNHSKCSPIIPLQILVRYRDYFNSENFRLFSSQCISVFSPARRTRDYHRKPGNGNRRQKDRMQECRIEGSPQISQNISD